MLKYFLVFSLSLISCGGGGGGNSTSQKLTLEIEVSNLAFPIRIGELPGNKLIIAELDSGKIIAYDREKKSATTLVTLAPANGDAIGIAGLLVDRDFDNNHYVFVYHLDPQSNKNSVTRLTVENDKVKDRKQILFLTSPSGHNGGGMAQINNGTILLGVGDGGDSALPQALKTFHGKVIAFDRSGNLIKESLNNKGIYANGLRNPFGVDSDGERTFVADNGPSCDDEVDVLLPNNNYGWNESYQCGKPLANSTASIFSWSPSSGLTDILYYTKSKYSTLSNKLLIGKYLENKISVLSLNESRTAVTSEEDLFSDSNLGPFIDILQLKSGEILLTTPNSVVKIL